MSLAAMQLRSKELVEELSHLNAAYARRSTACILFSSLVISSARVTSPKSFSADGKEGQNCRDLEEEKKSQGNSRVLDLPIDPQMLIDAVIAGDRHIFAPSLVYFVLKNGLFERVSVGCWKMQVIT